MTKGILVIALLLANAPAMAEVTPSGKQLLAVVPAPAQVCVTCHGVEGEGVEPVGPRLAGLSSGYITQQIKHFLDGNRQNASMGPMAMTLQGDDAIKTAADYFSSHAVKGKVTPVLRGQQLVYDDPAAKLAFQGDWSRDLPACVTCHGPSGLGGGPFPRLAGQQANYIKTQLLAWQAGTRKGDPDGMMGNVASKLTAAEVDALSQYFANLK